MRAARSSCASRSPPTDATRPASRNATTPPSSPRCARSSARARSPWSARRAGAARSAASSSATSSQADFAGAAYPGQPQRRAGRRRPRVHVDRGDRRTRSISPSSVCPAEQVLDAASDALRRGVRALCVISAGFAETGAEGRERQDALLALVRAHGARLVGPNCLGIAVPGRGLNATFAPRALPPGRIGFSSQSGALGLALLEKAAERALGFSSFISIGNKADVSSNDLLEWWEDDADTDLVLLYLESFGNPRTFARVARRVARRKPILALKAGSTSAGSRAASSHTAALAGSDAAVDALFHQAGVLRARTLEELVDAAAVLSTQPLPRGRRVGVITNAGGLGILCADACESAGLELPELTSETRLALATAAARRGEPREPGRSPRLGDRGDLRGGGSARPRRPERRRADRDLRPSGGRRRGRGRGRDPARRRGRANGRSRCVAVRDQRRGHARRAVRARLAGRRASRIRNRPPARSRSPANAPTGSQRAPGTAPELDGIDSAAGRRVVDSALAESPDSWLPPAADPHAARGIRHPARPRADRAHSRRGRGCRPRARLPRRRQDGRAGSAQDRYRRRRARPSRRRPGTRRGRARSGCP